MLEIPETELRVLVGAAGVVAIGAAAAAAWALAGDDRRLAAIEAAVARLAEGEVHGFAPAGGGGALRALSDTVNRLGDRLRDRHLTEETDRMLERAMVRESPNGLLVTDASGRIRWINPALPTLMPVHGDPTGRRPGDVIPVASFQEVLEEATRTRVPAERTASLGKRDLLLRAIPLADGAGCLGVVLDVTSVRRAERARRDFVANVSHELRTPVTAIVGYAEALMDEKDTLPAPFVPMLEAIHRNADRLALLIEDVLDLSRIEAREADLPLEPEPVVPLVREVIQRFAPRAAQKGVALELGDAEDAEALLNADAFEHALNNLVDNATKYTPAGGRVVVGVRRAGDRVRVDVADTGMGIAPVHHERIFERFYRVDPGRGRDVGGTGLGLALVKHLCQASRAEVTMESEPGKGSTFTLWLPTT